MVGYQPSLQTSSFGLNVLERSFAIVPWPVMGEVGFHLVNSMLLLEHFRYPFCWYKNKSLVLSQIWAHADFVYALASSTKSLPRVLNDGQAN